jgi:hypothetical protein
MTPDAVLDKSPISMADLDNYGVAEVNEFHRKAEERFIADPIFAKELARRIAERMESSNRQREGVFLRIVTRSKNPGYSSMADRTYSTAVDWDNWVVDQAGLLTIRSYITPRYWGGQARLVSEKPLSQSTMVYKALMEVYSYDVTLDERGA